MTNDWKLAVAVRDDLAAWQKLNLTAFVASGIGTIHPELIGRRYVDGSGAAYLPMFALPVMVFSGDAGGVRRAFDRAVARELSVAVYTDGLFVTGNDIDNRAEVARFITSDLAVAGFGVAGDRRQVDKVFDKLRLHA